MTISVRRPTKLARMEVTDDTIRMWLDDRRTVTVPLSWLPRLCQASEEERNRWETSDDGVVRWPSVGETAALEGLVGPRVGEPTKLARLEVTDDTIRMWLDDRRTVTVPLSWLPRLCQASVGERNAFEVTWIEYENTDAIHWPILDEDVTVAGLMTGPTGEGPSSLGRWLLARQQGRGVRLYEIYEWEQENPPTPLR